MKTPSFPPIDCLLGYFSKVDYKKVAHRTLMVVATVCAIIMAISAFTYRKSRAFWEEHGDEIMVQLKTFTEKAIITARVAASATYKAGIVARPIISKTAISLQKTTATLVNQVADWVFYRVTLA
jgi:hypothetical protein